MAYYELILVDIRSMVRATIKDISIDDNNININWGTGDSHYFFDSFVTLCDFVTKAKLKERKIEVLEYYKLNSKCIKDDDIIIHLNDNDSFDLIAFKEYKKKEGLS